MYTDIIMDHFRNPRNRGALENPTYSASSVNVSCGDSVTMSLHLVKETILHCAHEVRGCIVSEASASIVSEYVVGKTIHDVRLLAVRDITALIGQEFGPNRLACIEISIDALKKGIERA